MSRFPSRLWKKVMPTSAGVAADRCADASLYRPFDAAGLPELKCHPQLVATTPAEVGALLFLGSSFS